MGKEGGERKKAKLRNMKNRKGKKQCRGVMQRPPAEQEWAMKKVSHFLTLNHFHSQQPPP